MKDFDLSSYHFDLPENLIAQSPVVPRDASRLMVVDRRSQSWKHMKFSDLSLLLDSRDLVVANNSRVLKARLLGHRLRLEVGHWMRGGRVEFVLLERQSPDVWEGLLHASARHEVGLHFEIDTPDGEGLRGEVVRGASESPFGTVMVRFDRDPIEADAGALPLPPYIERDPCPADLLAYQTVYSKHLGSSAAPTAGLHFSDQVIRELLLRGVGWEEITLHVGLGTFRPVKDKDVRNHKMHEERFEIPKRVGERIELAKAGGQRILAIGTTAVRALESAWDPGERRLRAGHQRTSIFIYPGGHSFQVVDGIITNFHLPRSSLLMLASAFGGRDLILSAYQEAVRERYRFFSYGDAMLVV